MLQQRVVIENINPQLQCGAFFIKRIIGEQVDVYADVFPDGHDILQAKCYLNMSLKKTSMKLE